MQTYSDFGKSAGERLRAYGFGMLLLLQALTQLHCDRHTGGNSCSTRAHTATLSAPKRLLEARRTGNVQKMALAEGGRCETVVKDWPA